MRVPEPLFGSTHRRVSRTAGRRSSGHLQLDSPAAVGVEGPVRESYLGDPRTPPAGWQTEIGWPVFGVR